MSLVLLKVGGAAANGVAETVAELRVASHQVCVVHGAGPQISDEMARRGLVPRFVDGRRVTTREVLEIVRESLARVNAAVCAAIGADAVPLHGDEIGLLAQVTPALGLVGAAAPSAPPAVKSALAAGLVPVVTPLAAGPLNVNADEAAAALAVGLGAERLLFLSDVPGVFHEGELLETIEACRAEALIAEGSFEGGIVPKLLSAARAARGGLVAEIGSTVVVA
jgi:acetylglutamate kinase